jgi:hypothetical protein
LSDSVFTGASDYEETLDEDQEEMDPLDKGFHLEMEPLDKGRSGGDGDLISWR